MNRQSEAPRDSLIIPKEIIDRWDPEYRDFILSLPKEALIPPHQHGWSEDLRRAINSSTAGKLQPVSVGSTLTIDLGDFSVLCLIPDGKVPPNGWPVFIYAHGGGLLFGDAKGELSFTARVCMDVKCVVISVDYRLAPEHTFPSAFNDVWTTLSWVRADGAEKLRLDKSHIAVGGYSSGATLSAAIAQRASLSEPPIQLVGQVIYMPSLDVTPSYDPVTWSSSMKDYAEVPGLWTLDVLWARDMHTPNKSDQADPRASPLLQRLEKAFKSHPPTWIGVADMDPLKNDGEAYAKLLHGQGVEVELKTYVGASHLTAVADGVCGLARKMQEDQIKFLNGVLNSK